MKWIIFSALVFAAGGAFAEDTMVLPGNQAGDVKFAHKKHAQELKSCEPCHTDAAGGKILNFGKETAHKLCKDCHVDRNAGPTKCSECHKQK